MESRPKRQSKKSAKLLTYELETQAANKKACKKNSKAESEDEDNAGEQLVPKLTIKFGKASDKDSSKPAVTTHIGRPPGRPRKRKKSVSVEKDLHDEKPSQQKAGLKVEPQIPTDVEIDAEDYEDLSDEEEMPSSPPVIESSAGKRQRKLPAKLAEFDTETELSANKAAKFFETKKAEQKAATALAKQEASKAGKKKRNRMPTAYTMWCNSYRAKLQAQCPGMSFAAMNKKLGEVWWSIPLKEKNQWNRKAKRLATHGTPKTEDSLKYLGSKAIASLQRNNCLPGQSAPSRVTGMTDSRTHPNLNPVYKVTQTEPVDVAAHLSVMADALTTIGKGLAGNRDTPVQGSHTILLDSLLSGMSALVCLTQQVPELDEGIDPQTHKERMTNIAHFIPNIS